MKKWLALIMVAVMLVATLTACAPAPAEQVAEEPAVESAAEPESEVDAELAAQVADAIERNQKRTGSQSAWEGPTNGPAAATGKTIACVMDTAENSVSVIWNNSVKAACEAIGWDFVSFDGKGTTAGEQDCMNQAIALGVDGIVFFMDGESMGEPLAACEEKGIFTVGIHASHVQGKDDERNIDWNITTTGKDIGDALADYAIADSNGKGRVIILYDAQYSIAREKAEAMQARIEEIPSMELLEVCNSPLADATTNVPTLVTSWVATYGTGFYVLTIADIYFDQAAAALQAGGVSPDEVKLVGSDGIESAYARIRNNEYQVATVPEPGTLFGYMAIDALNRLFAGQEPYNYFPGIYIVTNANVDAEGGDTNQFVPSNNFAQEYAKIWGVG